MAAAHPPRPAFTFRIGVIGNRWDKLGLGLPPRTRTPAESGADWLERTGDLEQRLIGAVRGLLRRVADQLIAVAANPANGYADTGCRLAVVSGLAEGADRIVAHAGLSEGYELWAILPFEAERYRDDFNDRWEAPHWSRPGAREEFETLRARATDSMVMDGVPGRYDAYEALGRSVLNHSDLVIAIWDSDESRGPGGTANLLLDARRDEVPVIRIDPVDPEHPWLEDLRQPREGRDEELSRLGRRLDDLVKPPEQAGLGRAEAWNGRLGFFAERMLEGRLGQSYRAMREYLLGIHGPIGAVLVPTFVVWIGLLGRIGRRSLPGDYEAACVDEWTARCREALATAPGLSERIVGRLAPIHGWLDNLARYYADQYRSAYTMIFSLAWLAGVSAVVDLVAHVRHWPIASWLSGVELVVIGLIFGLSAWGKRRHYHEKWIDYRHLAEQIRHLAFLWPLGAATGSLRMPVTPSEDDPRVGWTGWFYRATVRQLGLPTARVDRPYLVACRALLRDREIPEQRVYHDRNAQSFRHLHHVVHLRTEWLFFAALPVALSHVFGAPAWLAQLFGGSREAIESREFLIGAGLTALSVFLPARAAALHGWAGHADFHAGALRSAAIELRLEELERSIDTLAQVTSTTLGETATAASRAMEGELGAWRATSLSKPLIRA